jgi:putative MATE family efflux protein
MSHTATSTTEENQRFTDLAEMPIGRLLWQYSIPSVVGMLVMQLYNIIDRIVIGQVVGPKAIAGLAITFPVMNIATAIGVLIGAGATARISLYLGAGNINAARRILGNSLVMTLSIGIVYIGLFAIFLNPILQLFGADEQTLPYARDFMLYILPGLLMTNLTYSFNNMMRATGYPSRAMITMFIGAGINILLAPTFVYFFQWGIKGVAIASDIAMTISMIFVMSHFCSKKNGPVIFTAGTYRLSRSLIWGIIGIGAAPSIINIASCLINIFINNSLKQFGGYEAIAASGIFVTYTSMLTSIVLGICQGMQPIAGYNYGNGNRRRVRKVLLLATSAASLVTIVGWFFGITTPEFIARAFVSDANLVRFTGHALSTAMMFFFVVGFQVIATTYFQSIGKVSTSIFLSLVRQVIFLLPLLMLLPRFFGLDGIWLTFPVSDILATIVSLYLVIKSLRNIQ